MPRTRKTLSGAPAQPIGAIAGQQYGADQALMDVQRTLPAPQVDGVPVAPATAPATPGPQPGQVQRMDKAQVLELAKGLREKMGLLTQTSQRPQEPVTSGLSSGPGRGPEILQTVRRTPTGDTMRRIAQLSGDFDLAEIADRAGI